MRFVCGSPQGPVQHGGYVPQLINQSNQQFAQNVLKKSFPNRPARVGEPLSQMEVFPYDETQLQTMFYQHLTHRYPSDFSRSPGGLGPRKRCRGRWRDLVQKRLAGANINGREPMLCRLSSVTA